MNRQNSHLPSLITDSGLLRQLIVVQLNAMIIDGSNSTIANLCNLTNLSPVGKSLLLASINEVSSLIFTDHWKLLGKKSREAFDYFIKSFKNNIEVFDTPSYFKDIHKYHQIIHETDLANNFSLYYKKYKKKLSKYMQDAISKGNKHSAKEYAEAIDFMKRSYESYKEVFEDYHGVLSPSSPGVALKGLKSTGTAEFNKVWSYLGTPCISLPILQGENNLPLGVQLIGAKYDDQRFLGVANWLEKECNN